MKIWDVIEGPFSVDDVLPDDLAENLPLDMHFNLCKVEVNGKIEDLEIFFSDFDSAYDMIKHFKKSIEPLEMEEEEVDK
jgi:hypothetical protein